MENRELDAWIAEHVMGWTCHPRYIDPVQPKNVPKWDGYYWYWVPERFNGNTAHWRSLPRYSTDISAAFEVVAAIRGKFTKLGPEFTLNNWQTGEKWEAIFTLDVSDYNAYADTPALAICLAAKQAIESETDKE